jgi:hypothetical protein
MALRLLVGLAVGAAIAFVVTGLARYHDTEAVTGLGSHSVEPIAEAPAPVTESLSPASQCAASEVPANSRTPQFAGSGSDPLAHSAHAKQDDPNVVRPKSAVAAPFIDDPDAVIGRLFPASDSVISQCQPGRMSPQPCAKVVNFLATMAEESRDPRWARDTETSLLEWYSQIPELTIRAIECRTSLCAIETSSVNGLQLGPSYKDRPSERVHTWLSLWARETVNSSEEVTVTLQLFIRRRTPRSSP